MAAFGGVQHSKIILFLPWQMLNSPTNSRTADGSPLFHTVYENLFQLWSSSSPLLMMSLESQPRVAAAAATTTSRRSGSSLSLDKVKEPPVGKRESGAVLLAASGLRTQCAGWTLVFGLQALLYHSATLNSKRFP